MEFKFSQHEIEARISKILAVGDETRIAERTGKSAAFYSQQFNPHDDREANITKAIRDVCALLDVSQERGAQLKCLIVSIIDRHVEVKGNLCTNHELEKADKEFSDIWKARIAGKSPEEQIVEIVQSEHQLEQLKKAVINEIKMTEKKEINQDYGFAS
jgi:hypothetical protein